MGRVAVVGAGVMGLAAAYHAARLGHSVNVFEASGEAGGMAAHFDLEGLSIERFYHFICRSDQATFDLLDELGIAGKLRWRVTTMGLYADRRLHDWGNPLALLRYPGLSLLDRLRYGLLAFVSTRRRSWPALEQQSAREWITRWSGKPVYEKLWKRLFELKFHEFADDISAAWIWTRVKRIGNSRRSMMEEELGYLEGGSETLVAALVAAIERLGGTIFLRGGVDEIVSEGGTLVGVRVAGKLHPADQVISTMPVPLVAERVPALPDEWKQSYGAINNIGVACVVLKLSRQVTSHFWVNIIDPAIEIPGLIEFSNLRPLDDAVIFAPYYMPLSNPKWQWSDEQLIDEVLSAIQAINPTVERSDVLAARVGRLKFAQPVCEPGFAAKLPPVQTPIAGLQIADTCFYYPEDRGISESVRLGREMAETLAAADKQDLAA